MIADSYASRVALQQKNLAMGKKKDKQKMIEDARMQRKTDRELKIKMRKKMSKADAFKLSNIYLQYYASFDKQLAPLKIKLKDVVGDGNCLFRAFADQVDGSETTHILMREEACKYMVDHQEFFEPFLDQEEDGSFKNYISLMKKNGEWGGHLELQALSECFKCVVVVHKRDLEEFNVRPMFEEARSIIHLGYFQHEDFQHYVSIREMADDSDIPAMVSLQKLNKTMYGFLLEGDDPEQFLLRQQLQQMQIHQKMGAFEQEQLLQQQPYPNYPKNKRCKCGSKLDYKHCCFKEWQKKKEQVYRKG